MSDIITRLKQDNLGIWVEPYITNQDNTKIIIPQTIDSRLVHDSRKQILRVLPMDSLVRNLENAGDLVFLAFNAAAGTEIQSGVAGIQFSLHKISGQCVNTFDIYISQCQEIMIALIKIYKYLLAGKEALASIQLGYCAKIANQMGIYAKNLGESFENLYTQSYDVSKNSLNLRNLSNSEKANLTKELNEFNELQTNARTYQEQLLRDIDQMIIDHCDALSKIEQSAGGGFSGFVAGFLGFFGVQVHDPRNELREQENAQFSRQMNRLQQQKFENLMQISRYTGRISSLESGISDAAKSVESFQNVYKALFTIEVSLKEETVFWSSMEKYCNNLKNFKNLQPRSTLSLEKNIARYSSQLFINMFLRSLSQWMAIYGISKEGLVAARTMENQVATNIQTQPSIENAKKVTPELAKKLFGSVNMQIEALEAAKQVG
ncbi:hypothetical protein A2T98_22050 [Nodularia spumigena CENA596]|uniref:Uncharacterized protein n=1 Tax=Nodularia spumigena CENA596 TaxID=1819295 RepID=A0A166I022_NODSP|nr:hypothetical protein [Nodularia spumigena]KZL47677.1 hypothetical protein A2T98_22050 [Nodularia spumigena CENA596]